MQNKSGSSNHLFIKASSLFIFAGLHYLWNMTGFSSNQKWAQRLNYFNPNSFPRPSFFLVLQKWRAWKRDWCDKRRFWACALGLKSHTHTSVSKIWTGKKKQKNCKVFFFKLTRAMSKPFCKIHFVSH